MTVLRILNAPFAMAAIAVAIELCAVGWRRWSIRCIFAEPDPSRATDGLFFVMLIAGLMDSVTLVGSFGFYLLAFTLASAAGLRVEAMRFSLATRSLVVNIAVYMALYTLCDYWIHRIKHSGLFWPLHRLHHSSTHLSPLAVARNHPLELGFEPFARVWPVVLCPISMAGFVAINAFMQLHSMIEHIDIPWTWGWFGRWVLMSPQGHRIHHSPHYEHFNQNLSLWPVWDHLFGTWYQGSSVNDEVGLGEPLHNNGNLVAELGSDMLEFARRALLYH